MLWIRICIIRIIIDKKSENIRNQRLSFFFCLMTEGSGSVPLTNGSESGRPKNFTDPYPEHWSKVMPTFFLPLERSFNLKASLLYSKFLLFNCLLTRKTSLLEPVIFLTKFQLSSGFFWLRWVLLGRAGFHIFLQESTDLVKIYCNRFAFKWL